MEWWYYDTPELWLANVLQGMHCFRICNRKYLRDQAYDVYLSTQVFQALNDRLIHRLNNDFLDNSS